MNGHNHALTAIATYGAAMAAGHSMLGLDLPTVETALYGGTIALGVGLAPDIDEKHSIASQGAGIFGAMTRAITSNFGGHRTITHSPIVMATALAALAYGFITGTIPTSPWLGITAAIAIALGVPFVLGPKRRSKLGFLLDIVVLAVGVGVYLASPLLGIEAGWWLYASLPVAYLSHVVGDSITPAGIPWLYPFSKKKAGITLLKSGGFVENGIVTPVLTILAVVANYHLLTMFT